VRIEWDFNAIGTDECNEHQVTGVDPRERLDIKELAGVYGKWWVAADNYARPSDCFAARSLQHGNIDIE
jgi:hypothetical protein